MRKWALTLVLVMLLPMAAAAGIGDVVVGGTVVIRIRAAAGGLSASDRAAIVERRITEVLSRARTTPPVVVRVVGGQPAVFAGDVLIITADLNHARLNGTSQHALAEVWAQHLQAALAKAIPQPLPNP